MALVPWRQRDLSWDPFRDLERIQDEMNRLFDFSLARSPERHTGLLEGAWSPAVDIYDSKDNILVRADVPGLTKDEIDVSIQDDTLILKGEKKEEKEVKEEGFVRKERFYGAFNRTVALPVTVDAEKAKARYQNGVLELTLPKREEAKPKRIAVDVDVK